MIATHNVRPDREVPERVHAARAVARQVVQDVAAIVFRWLLVLVEEVIGEGMDLSRMEFASREREFTAFALPIGGKRSQRCPLKQAAINVERANASSWGH